MDRQAPHQPPGRTLNSIRNRIVSPGSRQDPTFPSTGAKTCGWSLPRSLRAPIAYRAAPSPCQCQPPSDGWTHSAQVTGAPSTVVSTNASGAGIHPSGSTPATIGKRRSVRNEPATIPVTSSSPSPVKDWKATDQYPAVGGEKVSSTPTRPPSIHQSAVSTPSAVRHVTLPSPTSST